MTSNEDPSVRNRLVRTFVMGLALTLLCSACHHVGSPMTDQNTDGVAARMLITFLRSILPDGQTTLDKVVLLPSHGVISDDAAAAALAGRLKPLACRAHAHEGALYVECTPLDPAVAARPNDAYGLAAEAGVATSARAKVRILAGQDQLIVPAGALAAFERQYSIEMPHLLVGRSPMLMDRLRGIRLILEATHARNFEHHVQQF